MNNIMRLNDMYSRGTKLYISGMPATPKMIEKVFSEKRIVNCMPYICYDERGMISEIHYSF